MDRVRAIHVSPKEKSSQGIFTTSKFNGGLGIKLAITYRQVNFTDDVLQLCFLLLFLWPYTVTVKIRLSGRGPVKNNSNGK